MLVENKYPLKEEVLSQMLKLKLETEEDSTMALELIRSRGAAERSNLKIIKDKDLIRKCLNPPGRSRKRQIKKHEVNK
ncbi:hypothetical protein Tco_0421792 [Tanacetum coccineum]